MEITPPIAKLDIKEERKTTHPMRILHLLNTDRPPLPPHHHSTLSSPSTSQDYNVMFFRSRTDLSESWKITTCEETKDARRPRRALKKNV